VEAVDVDGELVLWEPLGNRVHRLDRTASLLWPLLDGTATVGELSEDVADVFGIDATQAATDLEALLGSLAQLGLLDDGSDDHAGQPDEDPPTARYLVDPPDQ
jgi:hypothetical protein